MPKVPRTGTHRDRDGRTHDPCGPGEYWYIYIHAYVYLCICIICIYVSMYIPCFISMHVLCIPGYSDGEVISYHLRLVILTNPSLLFSSLPFFSRGMKGRILKCICAYIFACPYTNLYINTYTVDMH